MYARFYEIKKFWWVGYCSIIHINSHYLYQRLAVHYYYYDYDNHYITIIMLEMATTMNALVREHCDSPEYAILFQEVQYPEFISPVYMRCVCIVE